MKHKKKHQQSTNFKKVIFISFFVLLLLIGISALLQSRLRLTPDVKSDTVSGIVVDHTSVALFDQIPEEYIVRARDLRMLFLDQSVGVNISDGLSCLSNSSVSTAPNHCKRPSIAASELVADSRYLRSNWVNQFFPSDCGHWTTKVSCLINIVNTSYSNFDVVSYQFSYLDVVANSTIAHPQTGFFANPVYTANLNAFEAENPAKSVIYWTSSLSRSIGTASSTDFNDQMRAYAIANNKILFDVADIESHDPQGLPCYDNRDGIAYTNGTNSENHPDDGINYPAICQAYTSETEGGHLGSFSTGKIRIAKAFWVLMAQIAGWVPNGQSAPISTTAPIVTSTSVPQATATPLPTRTPVPTITLTPNVPNPTPIPSGNTYHYGFETLGSNVHNATVSTGIYGNALHFNGVDSYVNLGRLNILEDAPTFTFNVWVSPEFTNTELQWKQVLSDGSRFNLFYLGTTKNWRVVIRTTGGTYRLDAKDLSWLANSWHLISVTYDGSTAKLFWDGALKASVPASGRLYSAATSDAFVAQASVSSNRFNGKIDELRIYSNYYTDQQILDIYDSLQ